MTTRVIVLQSDGKPCTGASVRLSFHNLQTGGVSQPVQTDSTGEAAIMHPAGGSADVIVNGKREGRYWLPADLTIQL